MSETDHTHIVYIKYELQKMDSSCEETKLKISFLLCRVSDLLTTINFSRLNYQFPRMTTRSANQPLTPANMRLVGGG